MRIKIKNLFVEKERNRQAERQKLYNPDNLFKKNNKIIKNDEKEETIAIAEYKRESIIKLFWNKIKEYFMKK